MYGMIHQAAREMACEMLGEAEWTALATNAGLSDQHFIGVEYYSDADTMRMVAGIADRLGLSMDDALRAFGRHWIAFAGRTAYGRLLDMAGDDLESFLDNLDRMHASIKSNMPKAHMPSFQIVESEAEMISLFYRSERTGLSTFVQGILGAVAERFGEAVTVEFDPPDDDNAVLFRIIRGGRNA